jgi:hypothetical protein
MNIGDKVKLDGPEIRIGTIIRADKPTCSCKGKGVWVIELTDGSVVTSPIGVELELTP